MSAAGSESPSVGKHSDIRDNNRTVTSIAFLMEALLTLDRRLSACRAAASRTLVVTRRQSSMIVKRMPNNRSRVSSSPSTTKPTREGVPSIISRNVCIAKPVIAVCVSSSTGWFSHLGPVYGGVQMHCDQFRSTTNCVTVSVIVMGARAGVRLPLAFVQLTSLELSLVLLPPLTVLLQVVFVLVLSLASPSSGNSVVKVTSSM
mmetsp:Transcript_16258/g.43797  ORF Transcript_16258/g.43797 Transcript_16258/m.43797 type:complete len:203 (+) Transcript_16258:357-965(+)